MPCLLLLHFFFQKKKKKRLVLYKERNMLLTEQQLSRRRQLAFPQPDRFRKVSKSMGAIRQVLGERKRERIREHNDRMKGADVDDKDNNADDNSSRMADEMTENVKAADI